MPYLPITVTNPRHPSSSTERAQPEEKRASNASMPDRTGPRMQGPKVAVPTDAFVQPPPDLWGHIGKLERQVAKERHATAAAEEALACFGVGRPKVWAQGNQIQGPQLRTEKDGTRVARLFFENPDMYLDIGMQGHVLTVKQFTSWGQLNCVLTAHGLRPIEFVADKVVEYWGTPLRLSTFVLIMRTMEALDALSVEPPAALKHALHDAFHAAKSCTSSLPVTYVSRDKLELHAREGVLIGTGSGATGP